MKIARKVYINPKMDSKVKINKHIDDIFDAVYDLIDVPNLSLFKVVNKVKDFNVVIDSKIVEIIIQNKLDYHFADCVCPACGKRLHKKYSQTRKVITTIGTLALTCPYYYCSGCKSYHSPYETALNLRDGKYQHDVQKVAARMASGETFEESAEMLNEIYRFSISPDTVHNLTNEFAGEVQLSEIVPTPEEMANIVELIAKGQHRRPVFVFATDGAMAPIRTEPRDTPHCWKEVRGIRGYLVDKDHIAHVLSWHQISSKQEFREYLFEIKDKGIIPLDKVRLCCIGDGAQWIWDLVQEIFPECREVLDYYHCAEHLHKFAVSHFSAGKVKEWEEASKVRLFHNDATQVIAGLKRMKCSPGEDEKSRDNLVQYLENNKHRIDYGKNRRGGFPIGSGAIESANKFISHVRLKRSGAWWKVDYANNILKLRCAKYNSKFNEAFDNFEQSQRKKGAASAKLRRVK
jgi:hypothetical protein